MGLKEEVDAKLNHVHLILGHTVTHIGVGVLFWHAWGWWGVGGYWLATSLTQIPVRILKRAMARMLLEDS